MHYPESPKVSGWLLTINIVQLIKTFINYVKLGEGGNEDLIVFTI